MDFLAPVDPEEARLRPTYVTVSLKRLRANLEAVRSHVERAKVMAVLKANAYGHGLEAVARCLAPQADAFGVALVEEGIALRKLGIERPILVMGGIWTRQIPLFLEHSLTFTVPSLARLADIEQAAAALGRKARIQLKIDTGMERIGIHHYSAEPLLEAAARSPHVVVEGIYSHFANADAPDLAPTRAAARALSRSAALLRAPLAASAAAAHRQLGGAAAAARDAPRHGAAGDPALRRLPVRRGAPRRRGEAGARLALARRLLQGGGARESRLVRVDVAERPPRAAGHGAGRLRRRLLPCALEPRQRRAPRPAPSPGRAGSAWTR